MAGVRSSGKCQAHWRGPCYTVWTAFPIKALPGALYARDCDWQRCAGVHLGRHILGLLRSS